MIKYIVENQHNTSYRETRIISLNDLINATIETLKEPQEELEFFERYNLKYPTRNKRQLAKTIINRKLPYVIMFDNENDFAIDLSKTKVIIDLGRKKNI